jgi:hypothetical protein
MALVPKSLSFKETIESKDKHDDEYWTPEEISYIFTAWLKCNNTACGKQVVVSGDGGLEQ